MHRRTFVQLLAAAATAPTSLFASGRRSGQTLRGDAESSQIRTGLPALRVVSSYTPAAKPGMPGPYPGRVVAVTSDKCVDASTGTANDETVREMMARGMRTLTGASTTPDAWRRFFEPADHIGIKV